MSGKQVSMRLLNLIIDLTLWIGDKITDNGKTLLIFGYGFLQAIFLIKILKVSFSVDPTDHETNTK